MIVDFEEIIPWQKAQDLIFEVYNFLKNLKDFWFKNQIQRAWVSISSNIAEWFERKTNNEFKYFCIWLSDLVENFVHCYFLLKELVMYQKKII